MNLRKSSFAKSVFVALLLLSVNAHAQTPAWAFNIGSSFTGTSPLGTDVGFSCRVAPNGNVCMTGKFTGTVDLDPGPGVHNIVSNGGTDIFVACYSSAGAFIWGFGIGGANYDGGYDMAIDASNNVVIAGFIQTSGIDFDPGAGVFTMPFAGGALGDYEGDGFVAKYSSTGAFQWAKDLGGATEYDFAQAVATDDAGNVYVGGEFSTSMAVPGGPTLSTASAGPAYIIKYSPTGAYIWARNFGELGLAGVDCDVEAIRAKGGNIYIAGIFRGTSDFNTWGTHDLKTAGGDYDAYLAKWDTDGNYVFARQIKGGGTWDIAKDISLDPFDNIYVTGYSNSSSLTFDPLSTSTSTVTAPGGGGNYDMFLAKYSNAGAYLWGKVIGGTGDDRGLGIDVSNNALFVTGQFSNTVDFDSWGTTASFTSTGGTDVFLTQYNFSAAYLCGFSVGASGIDDIGYGLTHDPAGNVFTCGQFGGTGVDFNSGSGTLLLTSYGGNDAYMAKYAMCGSPAICDTNYFHHDTTGCASEVGIPLWAPAGFATYLWSTGSGLSNISVGAAGAYWVKSTSGCNMNVDTFQVTILSAPAVSAISGIDTICPGDTVLLTDITTGGAWNSSDTTVASISGTGHVVGIAPGASTISYTVTNACGSNMAVLPFFVRTASECITEVGRQPGAETKAILHIYPNPGKYGNVRVSLSSVIQEPVHIIITNAVGEVVEKIAGSTNADIAIKLAVQAGIYFVNVVTIHGQWKDKLTIY